ncbi:MAG: hypothetical protein JRI42_06310 [Deltaproteobacteria bacterium]|nr:hypothetical protein [Deltaproteobacteria bacterium]
MKGSTLLNELEDLDQIVNERGICFQTTYEARNLKTAGINVSRAIIREREVFDA